jgi:hypothetical protein
MVIRRIIVGFVVAVLLAACGGAPQEAAQPTPAPTTAPTVAPTAVPTLTEYADILKQQLIEDDIAVQNVTAEDGTLPIVTVAYELKGDSPDPADIGPELERAIYTISKRVAMQVEAGTQIDRAVLVLMFGEQQVGSTRISTRDMVAWNKGDLTDQEYQTRWSQNLSQ